MLPVCFLHIPKTSGTSVALYLHGQFSAPEACPARTADEYEALGVARLAEFRLFHAETSAAVLGLLPAGTPVVTLLREPMARAVSYWSYIQRLPEHRLHEQFQREHGTFEAFLAASPTNPVARLLAAPADGAVTSTWEPHPETDCSEDELFERARARLEACAAVGVTERHDDTVALVAHVIGAAPPARLPVTNAAPRPLRYVPTDAEQSLFTRHNAVDIALHRCAIEMLDRQLQLTDARVRGAAYESRIASRTAPLAGRLVVDLCGPLSGSGWLRVVETELGPMRPLGLGGEATIDLPVRLGRFTKLELTCPAVSSAEALEQLRIEVDGTQVPFGLRPDPCGVTIHAALPASSPDAPFTRIAFRTSGGVPVPDGHTGARSNLDATLGVSRLELIPYDAQSIRASAPRGGRATKVGGSSQVLWQSSPTWTIAPDLQRTLDALDLWDNVEQLQRDGYTVVPEAIPPEIVRRARESIVRLATGTNHRTRRADVLMPLRVDPQFVDLLLHPVQLALGDVVCGKGLLDAQSGYIRDRTSNPQGLHCENAVWMPAPYPDHHWVCSVMLTLDAFDVTNGGTCFVPGSHLTRRDPTEEESLTLTGVVTPEVPPGSLIVWLGGTWHGAHQRTNAGERVSVLTILTRPSLRPTQNVRGVPDALLVSDELRLRLRRSDPFDHDGRHMEDPSAMLGWIRNLPVDGAVSCGWGETTPRPVPAL